MDSQSFEEFSVTFPPEIAAAIRERVNSGRYASASEVIREAMRVWMRREQRLVALDAKLARGMADADAGLGQDAEQVRQELKEYFKGSRSATE